MENLLSLDYQVQFFVGRHANCLTSEVVKATGSNYKYVYMVLRRLAAKGHIQRVFVQGKGKQQLRWVTSKNPPPAVSRGFFRSAN